MAVLYGNDALSDDECFRLKSGTPVFMKKVFVFQSICFKVKILKTFKISSYCHIKACRSLKWRAILKVPNTAFRRTYVHYWYYFEMQLVFLRSAIRERRRWGKVLTAKMSLRVTKPVYDGS